MYAQQDHIIEVLSVWMHRSYQDHFFQIKGMD